MKIISALFLALVCSTIVHAGAVDTILVHSNAMNKDVKVVIIKPAKYKKAAALPVVYLLHGYSGNYAGWIKEKPALAQRADELNVLFVCPDGGFGSWYFDSPVDPAFRYETFMTTELVPFIDSHYKTKADRNFRAIAGLSMGGHGAFYLAFRHLDLFGQAGSMAGGVDIRPFPKNWDLTKRLGDSLTNKENWEKNTVINIADQLQPGQLRITFDCGVDDFFFQVNRNLHQKLLEKKIAHDYAERPGGHTSAYWTNSLDYQLLFFKKGFEEKK
ncbi:MAG: alpha/beta hydrolase family protein [Candidatus Pseudobacter hemicellulosilyticus]|uniref:Alpha/beta hydrolase family protein n=1 Tax=Candidatus Pseudobacter hemicellulosilyticus TaxID=3121375 RepID=A0AAJ5WSD1_9BACT|nr:MAG: alpha/beta hydrolase family protein [Pseudobacter sp.]